MGYWTGEISAIFSFQRGSGVHSIQALADLTHMQFVGRLFGRGYVGLAAEGAVARPHLLRRRVSSEGLWNRVDHMKRRAAGSGMTVGQKSTSRIRRLPRADRSLRTSLC